MTTFSLGGLTVYGYGLALACAAALCLVLAARCFRRAGLRADSLSLFAVLALPLGVLCARALYCLIRFNWFAAKGFPYLFHLTEGGFVLYGAMGGCVLAALLAARLSHQSAAKMLDALSVPAAVMIALSRLAEGLAGQGYGWYVEDWFDPDMGMSLFHPEQFDALLRFPFAVQDSYEEWRWAVFVIEALIALAIAVALLRVRPRRDGGRATLFILMYAAMQALGESLRQDAVLRWGFVRVSQVLSAVIVGAVLLACCMKAPRGGGKRVACCWAGTLCAMLMVIAMEFALEKKIVFLEFLPMDVCYAVMALSCVGLILAVRPMWALAFPKRGEAPLA